MHTPRSFADALERASGTVHGSGERFSGYGVTGVAFESGDVLALRRFPASSLGLGYTAVWHRGPDGEWTFYSDVAPRHSCARYFGSALVDAVTDAIDVEWLAADALRVTARRTTIAWSLRLTSTPATRVINEVLQHVEAPGPDEALVRLCAPRIGALLNAGRVRLTGRAPNGQRFRIAPRAVWMVTESAATMRGTGLGAARPLHHQPALGDFLLPLRPLFLAGSAQMEAFDERRHVPLTSRADRLEPLV
jgi:hypothetical protein